MDPVFGLGHYPHHHTPTSSAGGSSSAGGRHHVRRASAGGVAPPTSSSGAAMTGSPGGGGPNSANSSLRLRHHQSHPHRTASTYLDGCGNRINFDTFAAAAAVVAAAAAASDPNCGVDTISPGETGALTPGSTFDASEVDRCVGSSGIDRTVSSVSDREVASQLILDRVSRELSNYSRATSNDENSRRFVQKDPHLAQSSTAPILDYKFALSFKFTTV